MFLLTQILVHVPAENIYVKVSWFVNIRASILCDGTTETLCGGNVEGKIKLVIEVEKNLSLFKESIT